MTPAQGVEDVVPGIVNPGEPPLPSTDTSVEGHPGKKKKKFRLVWVPQDRRGGGEARKC